MKTSNIQQGRAHHEAIIRGWVSDHRAGSPGLAVGDVLGDGVTIIDNGDGTITISTDGGDGDGGTDPIVPGSGPGSGTSSAGAINLLNNSGQDAIPGTVVVTDPNGDRSFDLTTDPDDQRIAGVVQDFISAGQIGPVLFNGYTAVVVAEEGATRGEYLQVSSVAGEAQATTDRGPLAFGVLLSEVQADQLVYRTAVTVDDTAVTSLSINMPDDLVAGRTLLLALYIDDASSGATVTGWTQVGSTTDFWYFTKTSTGTDTAAASWTGASLASAIVVMFDERVGAIEDQDYEATLAAAVTALSGQPSIAVASVKTTPASVPAGWAAVAEVADQSGDTPAYVQKAEGIGYSDQTCTFATPCTAGNTIIAVLFSWADSTPDMASAGFTQLGSTVVASSESATDLYYMRVFAKTAVGGETTIGREATSSKILITCYEVANASLTDITVLSASRVASTSPQLVDLGTFTSATGLALMAVMSGRDSDQAHFTTSGAAGTGWTERSDRQLGVAGQDRPLVYVQTAVATGANLDAKCTITQSTGSQNFEDYCGIAVLFGGAAHVEGQIVAKFIGTDTTATSPFTGHPNAVIVLNLTGPLYPSALLEQPGIGTGGDVAAHIADATDAHDASAVSVADAAGLLTATNVETALEELAYASNDWFNVKDYGALGDGSTDDTAAIQDTIDAAYAAGGGTVYFPPGEYIVGGALQDTGAFNGQLLLPDVSHAGDHIVITFKGALRPGFHPLYGDTTPLANGLSVLRSTLTGASGTAAVISGGNDIDVADANNLEVNVVDLICLGPNDPTFTWWNLQACQGGSVDGLQISTPGAYAGTPTLPTHTNSYGIKFPQALLANNIHVNDLAVGGFYTGFLSGELLESTGALILGPTYYGLEIPLTYYPGIIFQLTATNVVRVINVTTTAPAAHKASHGIDILQYVRESAGSGSFNTEYDVYDPSNRGSGYIRYYNITAAGGGAVDGFLQSGGTGFAIQQLQGAWGGVTVKEEGVALATLATSIDFVGTGVTATGTGAAKTVTFTGGTSARILLADGHATPFAFTDLLQADDGSYFLLEDL